jgi:hypothetical protein
VSLGFSIPGSLIETLGKSAAQRRPTAPGGLVVPNDRTPRPSSTVPSL